jgi:hypothetical protein
MSSIVMFPKEGAINQILNSFASFIFERTDKNAATEKEFVLKLKTCHDFKTPLSLLQERIDKRLIDFNGWYAKGVLKEMIEIIEEHSKNI